MWFRLATDVLVLAHLAFVLFVCLRGGFVEHYLIPLIYPPGLTAPTQWALGSFVVAVNGILYGIAWRRWRQRSKVGKAG